MEVSSGNAQMEVAGPDFVARHKRVFLCALAEGSP